MTNPLQIIPTVLLAQYCEEWDASFSAQFDALKDAELSTENFNFYTSVASVFSSKIEGENIELDSFVKHKRFGFAFQPDYTKKIDDLYSAYLFAQKSQLTPANLQQAHVILSKNIVAKPYQGAFRTQNMYVTTSDGRIEYVAATPFQVDGAMTQFYDDIAHLCAAKLSMQEVFFFAAMLHLVFVKIHPFLDGNGRSARLLEKWFLAQHLGDKTWLMQSEKHYHHHHQQYYNNIRALGLEYDTLDYEKAMPFLLMLPQSLSSTDIQP